MRCMTVGRDGAHTANFRSGGQRFSRPLWVGKIYEAKTRADGVMTWRLVETIGEAKSGYKPSQRLLTEVEERADSRGIPFYEGIRHGMPVQMEEP